MERKVDYEKRVPQTLLHSVGKKVSVPVGEYVLPDPHHPLVGETRQGRLRYQIEMLELQIVDARQSGVTGENLERWLSKLQKKINDRREKLNA